MIKILKRKFILTAMSAISLVVLLLIGSVNIANYVNLRKQSDSRLNMLLEHEGSFPTDSKKDPLPFIQRDLSVETPFDTRFFTIAIDRNGNIKNINIESIAAVDEKMAVEYLNEIYRKHKSSGYIDYYRYISKQDNAGNTLYIFIDVERELSSFSRLLVSSLMIAGFSLTCVFILLVILSKYAIKPIVESYEKQRQFITNASHDLKTPLTIIDANTEIIEMEGGENEWTRSNHDQVARLVSLTNKLVYLSKMDEENTIRKEEVFSLSETMQESIKDYETVAKSRQINFESIIEENVEMLGVQEEIKQVINLLLDNAMKYCVDEIKVELLKKNNVKIIKFFNNVQEIKTGNHNELFERFYRIDNGSRNSEKGGHGIGLSIVKSIVSKHKGKISAKSDDDKSILFTIEFK